MIASALKDLTHLLPEEGRPLPVPTEEAHLWIEFARGCAHEVG
jgi:hypothetical protein